MESVKIGHGTLYHADCFDVMESFLADSHLRFDLILFDPPYGVTPLEWDSVLPFDHLWQSLKALTKDTPATPIVIFGIEPFSSLVRMSNLKDWRYDWYWKKERPTNILQLKRRPGKVIETASVFYKEQCAYYPQRTLCLNKTHNKAHGSMSTSVAVNNMIPKIYKDDGFRYPTQLLEFNREDICQSAHPTQKPISLLTYLIQTYTKPGDTVLDITAGSGSTAVAAELTGRKWVAVEKNKDYFAIAAQRICEAALEGFTIKDTGIKAEKSLSIDLFG